MGRPHDRVVRTLWCARATAAHTGAPGRHLRYSAFLSNVERDHGVDFSAGIPAGYGVLGELVEGVVEGVQPEFELANLERDAVSPIAPVAKFDGEGDWLLGRLRELYEAFRSTREEQAQFASDHICTACPVLAWLDLKMALYRGMAVRQTVGAQTEILGPAVNVAHRLLKNSIQARPGYKPVSVPDRRCCERVAACGCRCAPP